MSNTYENTFSDLYQRGFMTPTYLSSLVMLAVLPPQLLVDKRDSLFNDGKISVINQTHTAKPLLIDGIETLHLIHNTDQNYEIYFCGNGQDAIQKGLAVYLAEKKPNINHILWNYPGVGYSQGPAQSSHDLIEAGYKQAKHVLDQGVPADKITLCGLSLGGGVATQVARRLHEEGHFVNLNVDRSFARIASVIPASIKDQKSDTPLLTSVIALTLSGLAIGTTLAGLVASIGVVLTALATPTTASYIEDAFNYLGSALGAIVGFAGLLIGAVAGLTLGGLLWVQYLWTNNPLTVPMTPAFSVALFSTCCEMDSVKAIHRMLDKNNNSSTINVTNTVDDKVILPAASLNVGLGFEPGQAPRDDESCASKQNINAFWYKDGGHNGELRNLMSENSGAQQGLGVNF